ncbi:MAG: Ppx/GppA family phosphatase, partial [Phycisphaerales bacterium]|nr:Ppx/GppA family phosphatase [Phycisphaerales bacterium]
GYNVSQLRVIATCAVREASNGKVMSDRARDELGIEMEVISSDDEARFAYQSVAGAFDLRQISAAIVDVGGGSTEIVLCYDGVIEQVYSLPLGAVRLTELFGPCDTPGDTNYVAMRRHIRDVLKEHVPRPVQAPQLIFGTGGTFTNMASMSMHRGVVSPQSDVLPFAVRGYELQRDEIKHILHQIRSLRVRERGSVPGLNPDRAEIIVAGMAIVDRVMKRLGSNRVRVHDRGIRDGLLSQMVDELKTGRSETRTIDRVQSARRFANACRYEREHSEHVALLAMHMFDRLAQRGCGGAGFEFTPVRRQLLESAALLHDVGYLINYSRHHKHSYHLVVHSDMPGFTNRELEVVANVARYHRRAEPRAKHPNFMKLSEEDREVVRHLSAILRIADGLDRSHTQSVCLLDLVVEGDTALFRLGAVDEAAVNIWGAERKSGLFLRVFGLNSRFSVETLTRRELEARLTARQGEAVALAEAARPRADATS